MAGEIFVDAGAWIAVADADDQHHVEAIQTYPQLFRDYQRVVTTNLVVAEAHVAIRRGLGPEAALKFLHGIGHSPRIEKVYSTAALEQAAEDILRQYADQDFSFADAVSFALMRQRGITHAFAFDKHFSTAGFVLVP